jgi:hypothetical protein
MGRLRSRPVRRVAGAAVVLARWRVLRRMCLPAPKSRQLRAHHRRAHERGGEPLLRHRQQLEGECARILAGERVTRGERRLLQLPREADVPRTDVLGYLAV